MRIFFTAIFVIIISFFGLIFALILKILAPRRTKNSNTSKGFGGFGGFSNSNRTTGGSSFGGTHHNYDNTNKEHEGEVKVTSISGEDRKLKDKVGEYVDFDEVK